MFKCIVVLVLRALHPVTEQWNQRLCLMIVDRGRCIICIVLGEVPTCQKQIKTNSIYVGRGLPAKLSIIMEVGGGGGGGMNCGYHVTWPVQPGSNVFWEIKLQKIRMDCHCESDCKIMSKLINHKKCYTDMNNLSVCLSFSVSVSLFVKYSFWIWFFFVCFQDNSCISLCAVLKLSEH